MYCGNVAREWKSIMQRDEAFETRISISFAKSLQCFPADQISTWEIQSCSKLWFVGSRAREIKLAIFIIPLSNIAYAISLAFVHEKLHDMFFL